MDLYIKIGYHDSTVKEYNALEKRGNKYCNSYESETTLFDSRDIRTLLNSFKYEKEQYIKYENRKVKKIKYINFIIR